MQKREIDHDDTIRSIRQLTRIYKVDEQGVDKFVRRFVRKYNITRGYEDKLKEIVLDEIKQMN